MESKIISFYFIRSSNRDHPERYVGSTSHKLYVRFSNHKVDYNRFISGKDTRVCKSYEIFNKYGVENCEIVLITQCLCNKEERNKLERYWIEKTSNVVNEINPYRSLEEKKVYHHEWRHAKGKIECPCGGEYTATRQKEHEETTLHKLWLNGTPIIPKGIKCPCGGRYTEKNKTSHEKCARHIKYLESEI